MKPSTAVWRTLPGGRPLLKLLERIWNSDNKGSALVEMAVVLPLMFIMIFGMVAMGIMLNNYLLLAHAADVGARYLAINQGQFGTSSSNNPCIMAANQIQAAAVAIPANQISYTIILTPTVGGTASTYKSNNGSSSYAGGTCASGGSNAMGIGGGVATVSIQYPITPNIPFFNRQTINLAATTTEVIQ